MYRVGKAKFLKVRSEVERLLDEGYPVKYAYENVRGDFDLSYSQFVRYVRNCITVHRATSRRIAVPRASSEQAPYEGYPYSPI